MKNFLKIVLPVCFIMFSCSMETGKKQQRFKNVAEILSRSTWTETKNNIGSLALDFWHEHDGDTVALCYSMECILFYPYKLDDDKIIVY